MQTQERFAQKTEPLSVLNAIAAEASRTVNLSELLDLAVDQMIALTGMEGGAILLVDEDTQLMTLAAERNLPQAAKDLILHDPLPVGQAIPGIAAERCQLIIVEDSKDDERELPAFREAGVMTHVCIPLAVRGRALGVLGLIDSQNRSFTPSETAMFNAVGEQLGIAIERTRLLEQQAKLAERAQILNELMRIAVSSLDVSEVIEGIAEQVRRIIDFDRLHIGLHPAGTDYVETYAAAGEDPPTQEWQRLPLDNTPFGEAIRTGRPLVRQNILEEDVYPIERGIAEETEYRAIMYVPLQSKGRVIGCLSFGSRRPGNFGDSELQLAQEIAGYLTVVIEHTLLHEVAQETARLEERNRLAREIHDTLAQSLTGLVIQLDTAEDLLGRDPEAARSEIRSARGLARDSLEEARRSVWDLQPLALASGALTEALQGVLAQTSKTGIRTSIEVEGDSPDSIDRRSELTVLRIVQEALSNVRHHSSAKNVAVRMAYTPTMLRLQVSDDGDGFDPSSVQGVLSPTGGGFGLTSMHERARLAGGHLEVRSAPGMGTQIEFEIPYQPDTEEVPTLTGTSLSANRPQAPETAGVRVLVVDDHEVARQGIRNIIEQAEGLTVVGEAADGEAAVEQIRALAPDVVLMDVQMPKLDGVETLHRLRELGTETCVILLSVYAKDEHVFEGLKAGARGYLTKDIGRDDLVQAIRTVHEGGSLLQPVIASRLIERLDTEPSSELTERETEVLQLLASGARNKEIADQLFLSVGTVKFHVANIFQKLEAQTRTEAVRVANDRGLLNL
ncbi:MAG: GAF domain-containing protein [Dehalococcoidia bacterium]